LNENEKDPLKRALYQVMTEEFRDVPEESEIDIPVSDGFRKNCKRIIRQSRYASASRMRRSLRRLAVIAAIVVALAATALAVPSVRGSFVRFFTGNAGQEYVYSFDPQQAATAPNVIEHSYIATCIPEGFQLKTSDVSLTDACYYWTNPKTQGYIMLDQTVIGGVDSIPYSKESILQVLEIDGYQVFLIQDETIKYFWTDNRYFFTLYCGPGITEEESLNIFRGIEEKQIRAN